MVSSGYDLLELEFTFPTDQRNYLTDDILIAIKYFLNDRKIPHLFLDYSSGSIPLVSATRYLVERLHAV